MKIPFFARLMAVSLVCAAAAYAGTFLLRTRFRSTETLYFPLARSGPASSIPGLPRTASGEPSETLFPSIGARTQQVGSSPETAIGIMKSRACLREVVRDNDLVRHYKVKKESQAVKALLGRLKADVDKNGFLVTEVEDENPKLAAAILRSVRRHLERASKRLTVNQSEALRKFLEDQVKASAATLRTKRNLLAEAFRRSPFRIREPRSRLVAWPRRFRTPGRASKA